MNGRVVAICVQGIGHMRAMLPVLSCLKQRGLRVEVMTERALRPEVERIGAGFIDLFQGRPVESADDSSVPVPSRYVTFTGVHAEALVREVGALSPSLIVYETYSLMAPLIGRALKVPYVNVVPNHALVPERAVAELEGQPRVSTSPACLAAVERLRREHGLVDASPFSYVTAFSPHLNLYPEPREFLPAEDRAAMEPLAFFGLAFPESEPAPDPVFRPGGGRRRVFASLGTIVWLYYAPAALAALTAIARSCREAGDVELVVSLGGHRLDDAALEPLRAAGAEVRCFVEQRAALREADALITHHGINSTHEAILHRVPMLSYPFFGDQPRLAARCRELGLALPLAQGPARPVAHDAMRRTLDALDSDRDGFAARLEEARGWELRTVAERGATIDRILALAAA
jgi:MGT family glycosyltransferase